MNPRATPLVRVLLVLGAMVSLGGALIWSVPKWDNVLLIPAAFVSAGLVAVRLTSRSWSMTGIAAAAFVALTVVCVMASDAVATESGAMYVLWLGPTLLPWLIAAWFAGTRREHDNT